MDFEFLRKRFTKPRRKITTSKDSTVSPEELDKAIERLMAEISITDRDLNEHMNLCQPETDIEASDLVRRFIKSFDE